jgi:hypothetical protein
MKAGMMRMIQGEASMLRNDPLISAEFVLARGKVGFCLEPPGTC